MKTMKQMVRKHSQRIFAAIAFAYAVSCSSYAMANLTKGVSTAKTNFYAWVKIVSVIGIIICAVIIQYSDDNQIKGMLGKLIAILTVIFNGDTIVGWF